MSNKPRKIGKLDATGRIVIPSHIRERLGFRKSDKFEFTLCNGGVLITAYNKKCFIVVMEKT